MALLSIVVPLYNQEQYIEQCINSIQTQSLEGIEIIIVDDGSTDNSGFICDDLAQNDKRITVIHQKNCGLAGARYSGIKQSQARYITFVDADDFILEDSYSRALEYMNQDIDMIFFEISRYYNENRITTECHILEDGFYDRERIEREVFDKLIWDFDNGNPGIECSQCVRITKRELLLDRYNNLTLDVYYGEDMAITYPLYTKIDTMQVIPYSYYMHRQPLCESCRTYIAADSYFEEVFRLYHYLVSQFACFGDKHNLKKQIEYLYIYNVQLKKRKYGDEGQSLSFLFPFHKTIPQKKILLYGAGNVGRQYYEQLKRLEYCDGLLWVDRDAASIDDERVKSLDEIKNFNADYVVVAIKDIKTCEDVAEYLVKNGIGQDKIIYKY